MARFFRKLIICIWSAQVDMGDQPGGDREDREHPGGDAGLEADEDGKAAEQFDQADDNGGYGRQRQADGCRNSRRCRRSR